MICISLGHLRSTWLAGKLFGREAVVNQAVASSLQTPDTDFFHSGKRTLVPRKGKCLKDNSEYVKCGVCHVHRVHVYIKFKIKFLTSSIRYIIFLKLLCIHAYIPDNYSTLYLLILLYCS
jgi:hypothetical protein